MFVMLLHEENAAEAGHDKNYDSGSHAVIQSRLRATGRVTLPRGCADGK